jgi:hypothetical protein
VEGVDGDDAVEGSSRRLPRLERRADDLDRREPGELPAREGGEPIAELDADDLEAALGERNRRLARTAADLDQPCARGQPRGEVVEQRRRADRPRPVVQLRRLVECLAERAPVAQSGFQGAGSENPSEAFSSSARASSIRLIAATGTIS